MSAVVPHLQNLGLTPFTEVATHSAHRARIMTCRTLGWRGEWTAGSPDLNPVCPMGDQVCCPYQINQQNHTDLHQPLTEEWDVTPLQAGDQYEEKVISCCGCNRMFHMLLKFQCRNDQNVLFFLYYCGGLQKSLQSFFGPSFGDTIHMLSSVHRNTVLTGHHKGNQSDFPTLYNRTTIGIVKLPH